MKTVADIQLMCRRLSDELDDPLLYCAAIELGMRSETMAVLYEIIQTQAHNNATLRKLVVKYAMLTPEPIVIRQDELHGNSIRQSEGPDPRIVRAKCEEG